MANYAIIKDGAVINIIVWDGKSWQPPENCTAVPYIEEQFIDIGYLYNSQTKKFTSPE